jgi:transposase
MRGSDDGQKNLFSYVSLEDRIPKGHPLRNVRKTADAAFADMEDAFGQMYSPIGRPSIAPEMLLRALLLQVLFTIRSERQLMEQLEYNLLYRWFVGLEIDDTVWSHTTFSKNRDRLLRTDISQRFFEAIRQQANSNRLLSREHFSVVGTLIDACASMKSFRPQDEEEDDEGDDQPSGRNVAVDFKGERRSNAKHESKTDPDARLIRRKGTAARMCYAEHLLTENRNGLIVDAELTHATGYSEREAASAMVSRVLGTHRITVGADKGYDTPAFLETMREMGATPHIARTVRSKLDGRTIRHEGYAISLRRRKMTEERFGWMKVIGMMRKLRRRGKEKVTSDREMASTRALFNSLSTGVFQWASLSTISNPALDPPKKSM